VNKNNTKVGNWDAAPVKDVDYPCHIYGTKHDLTRAECQNYTNGKSNNEKGEDLMENEVLNTEAEPTYRFRVNTSISVKGVITWDCTVEGTGVEMAELLEKHDELIGQLNQRYPDQLLEEKE